jgi:hypothetical protein
MQHISSEVMNRTCLMVFQASTGISMMRMLPAAADAHIVCDIEGSEAQTLAAKMAS